MERLTKEQLKELSEISKLSQEEQKKVLPKFLAKLKPEQVEFLKKQQKVECPFCLIIRGEIKAERIYEDNDVLVILDINPASIGHTLVLPKKHYNSLFEIPEREVEHIFKVANLINKKIIESLKAEGSNIFVANGLIAGQKVPHVLIHVIPRYKDDGLDFSWEGHKISEKELTKVGNEISKNLIVKKEKSRRASKKEKDELSKIYYEKFIKKIP